MTERLRGRRAVEQRRRWLAAEPTCRDCRQLHNRVHVAEVIDHVVPLAKGGTDSDANIRPLCRPCHDTRTREQFGHKERPTFGVDGWKL